MNPLSKKGLKAASKTVKASGVLARLGPVGGFLGKLFHFLDWIEITMFRCMGCMAVLILVLLVVIGVLIRTR